MDFRHNPVLLAQTIRALNINAQGTYIDCTAGGGGHSAEILQHLNGGRLLLIDQDPQAIAALQTRFSQQPAVTIIHDSFFNLPQILAAQGIAQADGILADLGVSSHQLDEASRGFSYHSNAPLDMRMSMQGISAADIVNNEPYETLRDILYRWGEESYAPLIARRIVQERETAPITTTLQLAELVKAAVPAKVRRESRHPARKTFQALRIQTNAELERLDEALDSMVQALAPAGRLAVISFHSLEDRIVKQNFAKWCRGCVCPPSFPVCTCGKTPVMRLVGKPVSPGEEELTQNNRSRSARLRVAQKLG